MLTMSRFGFRNAAYLMRVMTEGCGIVDCLGMLVWSALKLILVFLS